MLSSDHLIADVIFITSVLGLSRSTTTSDFLHNCIHRNMTGEDELWRRPWWLSFLDRVSCSHLAIIGSNPFLLVCLSILETNVTVTSLTACCLAYTRSVGLAYFGTGAIMCSLSVKMVKKFLKQPRPDPVHTSRRKLTYG